MLVALTIGGLVLGVVVGLLVKRSTGSGEQAKDGADVVRVLGATSLLAGLLVAFVLSGASSSFSAARSAAKSEADTVDTLYDATQYVAQPFRQRLQAAAVCYARAVVGPEWDAMATGGGSPVPSNWTGVKPAGIRGTLITMTPSAVGFSLVQSADVMRSNQRSARLGEAKPTVPGVLYGLMIFLFALSLATLAYSVPRANNAAELAALGLVTVVFSIVLLLIADFDQPFGGVLKIQPSAMTQTGQKDSGAYMRAYGVAPPCDARGNPA